MIIYHHVTHKKKYVRESFDVLHLCCATGNVFLLSAFLFVLDKREFSQFYKKNSNEADGSI